MFPKDRHQRHLAVVVDLGEAGQHKRADLVHVVQEAEVLALAGQVVHEVTLYVGVFRSDWTYQHGRVCVQLPVCLEARRVGVYGHVAIAAGPAARRGYRDPDLQSGRTPFVHQQGVDIQGLYFRQLTGHFRDAAQSLDELFDILFGKIVEMAARRKRPGAPYEFPGQVVVQGGQGDLTVSANRCRHSARTEADDRAENGIPGNAHHHLAGTGPVFHQPRDAVGIACCRYRQVE